MDWRQVAAGALTGLVVGLTGVGGGALMTPLLLMVFGVGPAVAVGTDLWFAALTKIVAARVHHGRGLIDWVVVKRLWMGSLPASTLAMAFLKLRAVHMQEGHLLKGAIAVAVLLTALGLIAQKSLQRMGTRAGASESRRVSAMQAPLTIAAGALVGSLVALTSVGAGALGVVFLVFLYPRQLPPARLVATDIAHAIPLAIFAGTAHLLMGNVDFRLLGTLLCGSIPGVIIGAGLSARLPGTLLRWTLAGTLLLIGFRLWLSA